MARNLKILDASNIWDFIYVICSLVLLHEFSNIKTTAVFSQIVLLERRI